MTARDRIAVEMTPTEWGIVQEALDLYFYETEHSRPGGFTRKERSRRQLRDQELLELLPELDRRIGAATGDGALFG